MTFDSTPGGTPGVTYNGFAGQPPPPPTRARRSPPSRKAILAGIAGAVGLGLVLGVMARPDFGDDGRAREPMRPAAKIAEPRQDIVVATPPDEGMEIVVNKPVVAPLPKSTGPIEVMSPELIRAAQQPATVTPRPVPMTPRPGPVGRVAQAPAPKVVASAPRSMPPPPSAETGFRRTAARPSFDCNYARTRSEQMVCGDADLAAADRRLDRAYRQAVEAGVPPRVLRNHQDRWLDVREDAARYSPQAVANVYAQRTRELEDLAEGVPEGY